MEKALHPPNIDTDNIGKSIAEEQLDNIHEFLSESEQEINKKKKQRTTFIRAITSLCIIAVILSIITTIESTPKSIFSPPSTRG
ncbi:MAG: hypothetical protein FVQ77_02695 [Cytophagales bacterium]|nr:hypothetical protein [Cytophagales bacterium]